MDNNNVRINGEIDLDLNVDDQQINALAEELSKRFSAPLDQMTSAIRETMVSSKLLETSRQITSNFQRIGAGADHTSDGLQEGTNQARQLKNELRAVDHLISNIATTSNAIRMTGMTPTSVMSLDQARRLSATRLAPDASPADRYRYEKATAMVDLSEGRYLTPERARRLQAGAEGISAAEHSFGAGLVPISAFAETGPRVYGNDWRQAQQEVQRLLANHSMQGSAQEGYLVQNLAGAQFMNHADRLFKEARSAMRIFGEGPEGAFDTDTTMMNVANLMARARDKYGISRGMMINPTVHGEADAVIIDPKTHKRIGIEAKSGISWDGFDTGGMSFNKMMGYYRNAASTGGILRTMTTKYGESPINFLYGEAPTEGVVRQRMFGRYAGDKESWVEKNKHHNLWTDAEVEEARRSTGDYEDDERRMKAFDKLIQERVKQRNAGKTENDKGYIKFKNAGTDEIRYSEIIAAEEQEFYRRKSKGQIDYSKMTPAQIAKFKNSADYKEMNRQWKDHVQGRLERNVSTMGLQDDEVQFLRRLAMSGELRGKLKTKSEAGGRSEQEIAYGLAERFGMKRSSDGEYKNLKAGLLNSALYGGENALDVAMVGDPRREFLKGVNQNGIMDRIRSAKNAVLSRTRGGAARLADQVGIPTPREISPAVSAHGPPAHIADATRQLRSMFGDDFNVGIAGMSREQTESLVRMAQRAAEAGPSLRGRFKGTRVGSDRDFDENPNGIAFFDHRTGEMVLHPNFVRNPGKVYQSLQGLQRGGALARGGVWDATFGHELGHAIAPGGEDKANIMASHLMGRQTAESRALLEEARIRAMPAGMTAEHLRGYWFHGTSYTNAQGIMRDGGYRQRAGRGMGAGTSAMHVTPEWNVADHYARQVGGQGGRVIAFTSDDFKPMMIRSDGRYGNEPSHEALIRMGMGDEKAKEFNRRIAAHREHNARAEKEIDAALADDPVYKAFTDSNEDFWKKKDYRLAKMKEARDAGRFAAGTEQDIFRNMITEAGYNGYAIDHTQNRSRWFDPKNWLGRGRGRDGRSPSTYGGNAPGIEAVVFDPSMMKPVMNMSQDEFSRRFGYDSLAPDREYLAQRSADAEQEQAERNAQRAARRRANAAEQRRKREIAAEKTDDDPTLSAKARAKAVPTTPATIDAAWSLQDELAISQLDDSQLRAAVGMLDPKRQLTGIRSAIESQKRKAKSTRSNMKAQRESILTLEDQLSKINESNSAIEQALADPDVDEADKAAMRDTLTSNKAKATQLQAQARRARTALRKQAQSLIQMEDNIVELTNDYAVVANNLGQAPGESDEDYNLRRRQIEADLEQQRRYAKASNNRRKRDKRLATQDEERLVGIEEGADAQRYSAARIKAADAAAIKEQERALKALAEAEEMAAREAAALKERQEQFAATVRGIVVQAIHSAANGLKQFGQVGSQVFQRLGQIVKSATVAINQGLSKMGQIVSTLSGQFLGLGRAAQGGMGGAKKAALEFYAAGYGIQQAGMTTRMAGQMAFQRINMGLQDYMEYEKTMNKASVFSGAPSEVVQEMTFGLQRGKFGGMSLDLMGSEDITRGIYYLSSALGEGALDVENFAGTGNMLANMLTSASISETDPETMIKGVLSIAQQFGFNPRQSEDAEGVSQISRLVTLLAGMSSLEITDIVESMKMVGPRLNVLSGAEKGQGISEAMALNYFASEVGLRGSKVGRGIDQLLSTLQDPPEKVAKQAASAFGYGDLEGPAAQKVFRDLFFTSEGTLEGGVFGFLQKLMDRAANDPQAVDQLIAMLFTQNAARTAGGISIAQLRNKGEFQDIMGALSMGDNEAALKLMEDAYLQTSETVSGAFQRIRNAWFQVQARIIDSVKGPLINAMQTFANILFEIGDVIQHNQFIGKLVSGLLAVASAGLTVLGAMLSITGSIFIFQRALMTAGGFIGIFKGLFLALIPSITTLIPLILGVAVVGALLVAAWKRYGDDLKEIYTKLGEDFSVQFTQKMIGFLNQVLPYVEAFVNTMLDFGDRLLFGYEESGQKFAGLVSIFQNTFTTIKPLLDAFIKGFMSGFGASIMVAIQLAVAAITKFIDAMSQFQDSITSIRAQADEWDYLSGRVENFGTIVGAVIGGILMVRLAAAMPMVNNLVTGFARAGLAAAKAAVGIAGFALQLAFTVARYVVLSAAALAYAGVMALINGVTIIAAGVKGLHTAATIGLTVATGGLALATGSLLVILGGVVLIVAALTAGYLLWVAATDGLGAAQEKVNAIIEKAKLFIDGLILGLTPAILLIQGFWEALKLVGQVIMGLAERFLGVNEGIKLLGIGIGILITSFVILAGATVIGAVFNAIVALGAAIVTCVGFFLGLFAAVGIGTAPVVFLAAVVLGVVLSYDKWGDRLNWLINLLKKANDLLRGHADAIAAVGAAALAANRVGGAYGTAVRNRVNKTILLNQTGTGQTGTGQTGGGQTVAGTDTIAENATITTTSGVTASGKQVVWDQSQKSWVYTEGTTEIVETTEYYEGVTDANGNKIPKGTKTEEVRLGGQKVAAGDMVTPSSITPGVVTGPAQRSAVARIVGAPRAYAGKIINATKGTLKAQFGTRPKFRGFGSAMNGAITGLVIAETGKAMGLPTDIMDIAGAAMAGFGVAGPYGALAAGGAMGAWKLYNYLTDEETNEKTYGFKRAQEIINSPDFTVEDAVLRPAREAGLQAYLTLAGGDLGSVINPSGLETEKPNSIFNMEWFRDQNKIIAKAQQALYERYYDKIELGLTLEDYPTIELAQQQQGQQGADVLAALYQKAAEDWMRYQDIAFAIDFSDAKKDTTDSVAVSSRASSNGKTFLGSSYYNAEYEDLLHQEVGLQELMEYYYGIDITDQEMTIPGGFSVDEFKKASGGDGVITTTEFLTEEGKRRLIDMKMAADQTAFLTMVTQGVVPVNPGAIYASPESFYNSITGVTRESIVQSSLLTGAAPANLEDVKVLDPRDIESARLLRLALMQLGVIGFSQNGDNLDFTNDPGDEDLQAFLEELRKGDLTTGEYGYETDVLTLSGDKEKQKKLYSDIMATTQAYINAIGSETNPLDAQKAILAMVRGGANSSYETLNWDTYFKGSDGKYNTAMGEFVRWISSTEDPLGMLGLQSLTDVDSTLALAPDVQAAAQTGFTNAGLAYKELMEIAQPRPNGEKIPPTATEVWSKLSPEDKQAIYLAYLTSQGIEIDSNWTMEDVVSAADNQAGVDSQGAPLDQSEITTARQAPGEFETFIQTDFMTTAEAIATGTEAYTSYDMVELTATEEESTLLNDWVTAITSTVAEMMNQFGISMADVEAKLGIDLDNGTTLSDIMRDPSMLFDIIGLAYPQVGSVEDNSALTSDYSKKLREYEAAVVYDNLYQDHLDRLADPESPFYIENEDERKKEAIKRANTDFVQATASDGSKFTDKDIPRKPTATEYGDTGTEADDSYDPEAPFKPKDDYGESTYGDQGEEDPGQSAEQAAALEEANRRLVEFAKLVQESGQKFSEFMANASLADLAQVMQLFGDMDATTLSLPEALIGLLPQLDQNIQAVAPEGSLASGMEMIYDVVGMGGYDQFGVDGNLYGDNIHEAIKNSPGAQLFAEQFGISMDDLLKDVPKFVYDQKYMAGAQASMLKTVSMLDKSTYKQLDMLGGPNGFDFEDFNKYAISKLQGGESFDLLSYLMESQGMSEKEAQSALSNAGIDQTLITEQNYATVADQIQSDILGLPIIQSATAKSVLAQLQQQQADGSQIFNAAGQLQLDPDSIAFLTQLVEEGSLTPAELSAIIIALGGNPSAGIVSVTDDEAKTRAGDEGDPTKQRGSLGQGETEGDDVRTPSDYTLLQETTATPGSTSTTKEVDNSQLANRAGQGGGTGTGSGTGTGETRAGIGGKDDLPITAGTEATVSFEDYGNGTNLAVFDEKGNVIGSVDQGTRVVLTGNSRERNGNFEVEVVTIMVGGTETTTGWVAIGTVEQGNMVFDNITPGEGEEGTEEGEPVSQDGLSLTESGASMLGVQEGTELGSVTTDAEGTTTIEVGALDETGKGSLGTATVSKDGQTITMTKHWPHIENGVYVGTMWVTATSTDGGDTWTVERKIEYNSGLEKAMEPETVESAEEVWDYDYNAEDFVKVGGIPEDRPGGVRSGASASGVMGTDGLNGTYLMLAEDGNYYNYTFENGRLVAFEGIPVDMATDPVPLPSFMQDAQGKAIKGTGLTSKDIDTLQIANKTDAEELARAGIKVEDVKAKDANNIIKKEHVEHYYDGDTYVYSARYYSYVGGETGTYYGSSPIETYVDPELKAKNKEQPVPTDIGEIADAANPRNRANWDTSGGAGNQEGTRDGNDNTAKFYEANGYDYEVVSVDVVARGGAYYLETTLRWYKWVTTIGTKDQDVSTKLEGGITKTYEYIGPADGTVNTADDEGNFQAGDINFAKKLEDSIRRDDPNRIRKIAALKAGNYTYRLVGAPYTTDDGWYQDVEVQYLEVTQEGTDVGGEMNKTEGGPTVMAVFETDIESIYLGESILNAEGEEVRYDSAEGLRVRKPTTGAEQDTLVDRARTTKNMYHLKVTRYSDPYMKSDGNWYQKKQVTELVLDNTVRPPKVYIIKQEKAEEIQLTSFDDAYEDEVENLGEDGEDTSGVRISDSLVAAPEAEGDGSVKNRDTGEVLTPISKEQRAKKESKATRITYQWGNPFVGDDDWWYQPLYAFYYTLTMTDQVGTVEVVDGPVLVELVRLNKAIDENNVRQPVKNAKPSGAGAEEFPDLDGDRIPDEKDPDRDGDGVGNVDDPYPDDATQGGTQQPDTDEPDTDEPDTDEPAEVPESTTVTGEDGTTATINYGVDGKTATITIIPPASSGGKAGTVTVTPGEALLYEVTLGLKDNVFKLSTKVSGLDGAVTGLDGSVKTLSGSVDALTKALGGNPPPSTTSGTDDDGLITNGRTMPTRRPIGADDSEGDSESGGLMAIMGPDSVREVADSASSIGSGLQDLGTTGQEGVRPDTEAGGDQPIDLSGVVTGLSAINAAAMQLVNISGSGFNTLTGIMSAVLGRMSEGMLVNVINRVGVFGDVGVFIRGNAGGPLQVYVVNQKAATGGFRSGITLVGEQGPEIVHLPSGSRVYSFMDTRNMLGNWTGTTPASASAVVDTWSADVQPAIDAVNMVDASNAVPWSGEGNAPLLAKAPGGAVPWSGAIKGGLDVDGWGGLILPYEMGGSIIGDQTALVGESGPEFVSFGGNLTEGSVVPPSLNQVVDSNTSSTSGTPVTVNFHGDMNIRSDQDIKKLVDEIDREIGRRQENANRGMIPTNRTLNSF